MPSDEVAELKKRLGALQFLHCEHLDAAAAHRCLGEAVRPQAQRILRDDLTQIEFPAFTERVRWIRDCQAGIRERGASPRLHASIRSALNQFLDCLHAWADGAQLADALPVHLNGQTVDGQPVTAAELGLLLQDEYSGCQTGVYRHLDGSTFLWHTEEEVDAQRIDALRLFSFNIGTADRPLVATSFIYPDLMPGSAFNWRSDGLVQVVDALILQTSSQPGAFLANAAMWVALCLEKELPREMILEALFPFVDGYALHTLWAQEGLAQASRIAFNADILDTLVLPPEPGSQYYQCNYLPDPASPVFNRQAVRVERLPNYLGRIQRAEKAAGNLCSSADPLQAVFELMASTEGEGWAYVNPAVKAGFICRLAPAGQLTTWVCPGPAAGGDWISGSPATHPPG